MTQKTISRTNLEALSKEQQSLLRLALFKNNKTNKPLEVDVDTFELKPTVAMLLGESSVTVLTAVTKKPPHYIIHDHVLHDVYQKLLQSTLSNAKALEAFKSLYKACEAQFGEHIHSPHIFILSNHTAITKPRLDSWIQSINQEIAKTEYKQHLMPQLHGHEYLRRKSLRILSNTWSEQKKLPAAHNNKRCHAIVAACVCAIATMASGITVKLLIDSPTFLLTPSWQATLTANPGILAASLVAAVAGSATIVALVLIFTHLKQKTTQKEKAKKQDPPPKATTYLESATKATRLNRTSSTINLNHLKPRSLSSQFNSVAHIN